MSVDFFKLRGFALIEILLVMGVIVILATAAFVIFPKIQEQRNNRMAQEARTTQQVREAIVAKAEGRAAPTTLVKPGQGVLSDNCEDNADTCVREYHGN